MYFVLQHYSCTIHARQPLRHHIRFSWQQIRISWNGLYLKHRCRCRCWLLPSARVNALHVHNRAEPFVVCYSLPLCVMCVVLSSNQFFVDNRPTNDDDDDSNSNNDDMICNINKWKYSSFLPYDCISRSRALLFQSTCLKLVEAGGGGGDGVGGIRFSCWCSCCCSCPLPPPTSSFVRQTMF